MPTGYTSPTVTPLISEVVFLYGGIGRLGMYPAPGRGPGGRCHSCWLVKKDLVSLQTGFTQSGQLNVNCLEHSSFDWMCECTRSARACRVDGKKQRFLRGKISAHLPWSPPPTPCSSAQVTTLAGGSFHLNYESFEPNSIVSSSPRKPHLEETSNRDFKKRNPLTPPAKPCL